MESEYKARHGTSTHEAWMKRDERKKAGHKKMHHMRVEWTAIGLASDCNNKLVGRIRVINEVHTKGFQKKKSTFIYLTLIHYVHV
jgi:hypothetical protein